MPFVIHVEYITGYAVAQTPGGEAEWPPHPARLFMALVAAVYETGGDAGRLAALEWLETLAPPAVIASGGFERSRPDVYVPRNDATSQSGDEKEKIFVLPQCRTNRRPRTFARFRPDDPNVTFEWRDDPSGYAEELNDACESVTRLGHSASLVHCRLDLAVVPDDGRVRWKPDDFGNMRLRVTNDGTLRYLDDAFDAKGYADLERRREEQDALARRITDLKAERERATGKGSQQRKAELKTRIDALADKQHDVPDPPPRQRPAMRVAHGYRKATAPTDAPGTLFDPRPYVFTLSRLDSTFRFLSAERGPDVCAAMRGALMSKAGDDAPPTLSGHDADKSPIQGPHVRGHAADRRGPPTRPRPPAGPGRVPAAGH